MTPLFLINTAEKYGSKQWRREGFCRPGQTSVLPPPLDRSAIDILMGTTQQR